MQLLVKVQPVDAVVHHKNDKKRQKGRHQKEPRCQLHPLVSQNQVRLIRQSDSHYVLMENKNVHYMHHQVHYQGLVAYLQVATGS